MDLSSLGATTGGVWTRKDALGLVTPAAVRTFLFDGDWQVLLPGVYTDGGHVPTAQQRAWAAVLASGGSHQPSGGEPVRVAAAGRTAARLWAYPLIDDADPATGGREEAIDDC